jgi:transcriptional regulator of acetoin/glycerol metabolism
MLSLAAPSLDRLFQSVGGVGCCVLLSDRDGVPLDRRGATADDLTFENWGLWPGTLWSEAQEGANGIGTCLAEGRAVAIHRNQHFLARNTALGCIAAPIHDAVGIMIGVLGVLSCRSDLTEEFS